MGIILDRTRHAANIGAVCRVLKNLGYTRLHLVTPTEFGHISAIRMMQGSEDIMESSRIHDSIEEATGGYRAVFATSRRMKQDNADGLRIAARKIASLAIDNEVAILFGSEKYGLARDDVDMCSGVITLPVATDFSSVNLAQAVAMVALEVKLALEDILSERKGNPPRPEKINISMKKRHQFYGKFSSIFSDLGFDAPSVYGKIQELFDRANITEREVNLFYGLIKEIRRSIKNRENGPD